MFVPAALDAPVTLYAEHKCIHLCLCKRKMKSKKGSSPADNSSLSSLSCCQPQEERVWKSRQSSGYILYVSLTYQSVGQWAVSSARSCDAGVFARVCVLLSLLVQSSPDEAKPSRILVQTFSHMSESFTDYIKREIKTVIDWKWCHNVALIFLSEMYLEYFLSFVWFKMIIGISLSTNLLHNRINQIRIIYFFFSNNFLSKMRCLDVMSRYRGCPLCHLLEANPRQGDHTRPRPCHPLSCHGSSSPPSFALLPEDVP